MESSQGGKEGINLALGVQGSEMGEEGVIVGGEIGIGALIGVENLGKIGVQVAVAMGKERGDLKIKEREVLGVEEELHLEKVIMMIGSLGGGMTRSLGFLLEHPKARGFRKGLPETGDFVSSVMNQGTEPLTAQLKDKKGKNLNKEERYEEEWKWEHGKKDRQCLSYTSDRFE